MDFPDIHAINTYIRHIIWKTGESNTHELIMDLKERGAI